MKAVLVAGGAGYIGSHACKALASAGYVPVTVDNLSTGYRAAIKWGPFIEADLHNDEAIGQAVRHYNIVGAIHFAAFSLVGESVSNPAKYYHNNVTAAIAFASSLIKYGVKNFLFSSTAAVYGLPKSHLMTESHSTIPINPYGASKLAFEQALHWLDQAHDLNYTILRYFNAAGADLEGEIGESHEPETHLIPSLCKAMLGTGGALTVYGTDYPTADGTAVRDYIHVVDLAEVHVIALERMLNGGIGDVFNVGTGRGSSVAEVISAAKSTLNMPIPHKFGARRLGDPSILVADPIKLKTTLNWTPRYSDLTTIIRTAARWQEMRTY